MRVTRLCAAISVLAAPVWASEVEIDGLTITHRNEKTFQAETYEDFTFEMPEGAVTVRLFRRTEACDTRPSCPDTLTVTSLPFGWLADPMEITTPETRSGEIVLIPYAGF